MEVEDWDLFLRENFHPFDGNQLEKLHQLDVQYQHWNEHLNLISRKDMGHLYERHVLHSLAILKILPAADHLSIVDVGTGGGFPGIPLAIARPKQVFHLVDSTGKKIKAVREISDALGLENVVTHHARIEKLDLPVDLIVSRAVAKTKQLLKWTRNLNSRGMLTDYYLLKGGDLSSELHGLHGWTATRYWLKEWYDSTFFETKQLVHLARSHF